MGKASVPAQVFALIGVSTVAAAIHSLVVPVDVARESKGGFTVPGEVNGQADRGGPAEPEAQAEGSPGDESAQGSGAGAEREGAEAEAAEKGRGGAVTEPSETGPDAEESDKISLERASELHELAMMGETVYFLDARLEREYNEGHILGALSMPFTRLGSGDGIDLVLDLATPGDGSLFVIYCTGGDCEASEDTAIRLEQLGYTNIAIMADGYDDWAAAGLPVETP